MTKAQFKEFLLRKIQSIEHESAEDEGAMEYEGELQSIIAAIDDGRNIQDACSWVGETCLVTEEN